MPKIRLTKEFSFESAHALLGYDGKCSRLHGHSYKLFVTVIGNPIEDINNPKLGMVLDFGILKKIVNEKIINRFDHSVVLNQKQKNDSFNGVLFNNLVYTDFQPTCENMLAYFANLIAPELPKSVSLYSLRLYETATSFAEWFAEDN